MTIPPAPADKAADAATSSDIASAIAPEIGFLQHRVGDRIKDRYDVTQRLGGGNFGSVYRVLDTAVGNILACKEMHVLDNPATQTDERAAALDLFKREALNLATLRHPNIPAAYFDQEDGDWHICPVCGLDWSEAVCPNHGAQLLTIPARFYLMMDFIDGETLEEIVENQMTGKWASARRRPGIGMDSPTGSGGANSPSRRHHSPRYQTR